jgi:hypothetical protein
MDFPGVTFGIGGSDTGDREFLSFSALHLVENTNKIKTVVQFYLTDMMQDPKTC